jgi:hypothetical protein
MDLVILGVSVLVFGPPVFFLAMSVRHFMPLIRGMSYPWWAPLLGPFIFLNAQYFSAEAKWHRKPCAYYAVAFIGWVLALFLIAAVLEPTFIRQ